MSTSTYDGPEQRKRPAPYSSTNEPPYKYSKISNASDQRNRKSLFDGERTLAEATVVPLTREALSRLNKVNDPTYSDTSSSMSEYLEFESLASQDPKGAINAHDADYAALLEDRGIYFADDDPKIKPSNLEEWITALKAVKTDPEPNNAAVQSLKNLMDQARNGNVMAQSILPEIVPFNQIALNPRSYTVPDQRWHRESMIEPNTKPSIAAPTPNRTIGWSRRAFPYPIAMRFLDVHARPVTKTADLLFPLFTIELKADEGNLRTVRLQNLHNGATMVSNLYYIWEFYRGGTEGEFFDKMHAISLQLTAESIELSGYWATRDENGTVRYYGTRLRTWTLYEAEQYREARRWTLNAIDLVKDKAYGWLYATMESLDETCKQWWLPNPRTRSDQSSSRRSRSLASEPLSQTPSKRPNSPATREVLSVDEEGGLATDVSEAL